jgi:DNA repair protein RadA/Sms
MAKQPATIFVCQSCGSQSRKWIGQCPDCSEWNTMVEERFRVTAQAAAASGGFTARYTQTSPVPFAEIESQDDSRVESGIPELDRVLGGGIVAGSLVLIGGAPGIGKSTIVIQMADHLGRTGGKVLYVSGEESERQIKMRGERLGLQANNLFILPETNLQNVVAETEKLRPNFVIVDSIQTIFSDKIESAPGSVSQGPRSSSRIHDVCQADGHARVLDRTCDKRRLDRRTENA